MKRPTRERSEWKLAELAREAGVSPRTVRYYVQRGLLPPPAFRGPDTAYEAGHLHRLRAIRRMQEAYLPLDVIQEKLARVSPAELLTLSGGGPLPSSSTAVSGGPLPEEMGQPLRGSPRPLPERAAGPGFPASWRRWELAPGLELHLSDGAEPRVRDLAERLRSAAQND